MTKQLIAKRVYRKNGASVSVWQVFENGDGDFVEMVIRPARGRGRSTRHGLRPDEALSIAAMLIEAVYSMSLGFHITTRRAHAFERPRRRRS